MRTTKPGKDLVASRQQSATLVDLAPHFQSDQHGFYLGLLTSALANGAYRNIALTGAYGSGKSSILAGLDQGTLAKQIVGISLSTVGSDGAAEPEEENSQPQSDRGSTFDVNLVQKEIVKQLLYSAPAHKTPRFQRATPPAVIPWIVRSAAVAALVGTVLLAVAGLLPLQLAALAGGVAAGAVTFAMRDRLQGGWIIDRVSAGAASISLTPQPATYFDKHLDEIVYFFQVSKKDIVIFEDLDRFENVAIFEALRSLNTLLNAGRKSEDGPIRFIYAVRDSVFDRLGQAHVGARLENSVDAGDAPVIAEKDELWDAAQAEVERANRTKFFDLVIPVVPFITYRNAHDLMAEVFTGAGISAGLCRLAARHVPDMRLIRNLRTEFNVYAAALLARNGALGLTPDRLLAILLYKNTHLTDFERIRHNRSKLDHLYRLWRHVIDDAIQALTTSLTTQPWLIDRAQSLGVQLTGLVAILGHDTHEQVTVTTTSGRSYSSDEWGSVDLWRELDTGCSLTVSNAYSYRGRAITVTADQLWGALGDQDRPWDLLTQQQAQLAREQINFLQHCSWQALAESSTPVGRTFRDGVDRIGSELARDLIMHGYLDRYYAIYLSPYYGRLLSVEALSYIHHHIDTGEPDFFFDLTGHAEQLLNEVGDQVLSSRGIHNATIFDHLLGTDRCGPAIGTLAQWTTADKVFASRYLSREGPTPRLRRPDELVRRLTPRLPEIFSLLIGLQAPTSAVEAVGSSQISLDDVVGLLDIALSEWVGGAEYVVTEPVKQFLEAHSSQLQSLTTASPSNARAAEFIIEHHVVVRDVTPLAKTVRDAVSNACLYPVTVSNLTVLAAGGSIALDALRDCPVLYQHVTRHLDEYLDAVEAGHLCAVDRDLAGVIEDVFRQDILSILHQRPSFDMDRELTRLSEAAATDIRISALADVPGEAWHPLMKSGRVDLTLANVAAYVDEEGVDDILAEQLTQAAEIRIHDRDDEAVIEQVALSIVNASVDSLTPGDRVRLVKPLLARGQLEADQLTRGGPVVALLLEQGLLQPTKEAFVARLLPTWEDREAAIRARPDEFDDVLDPSLLPAAQVESFLNSEVVPMDTKRRVVTGWHDYARGTAQRAADLAGDLAALHQWPLGSQALQALITDGISTPRIIRLFRSATVTPSELQVLLSQTEKRYCDLSRPGTDPVDVAEVVGLSELLENLKEIGIVSSFQPHRSKGGWLRVYRHHPKN